MKDRENRRRVIEGETDEEVKRERKKTHKEIEC